MTTVPKDRKIDLDGDGTPDLIVKDTNGDSIYISIKWLIGIVGTAGAAIIGLVVL